MPISTLEQNTVSRSLQVSRQILDQIKPQLDSLDVIYNSAGGVKETLTQEELDEVGTFSDLTKQQLDEGLYALTATLRSAINDAYAQLCELAARA